MKQKTFFTILIFSFVVTSQANIFEAVKNVVEDTVHGTGEIVSAPFKGKDKGTASKGQDSWCQTLSGQDSSVAHQTTGSSQEAIKKNERTACKGDCKTLCKEFDGVTTRTPQKTPMQTPDGICYCCCNK